MNEYLQLYDVVLVHCRTVYTNCKLPLNFPECYRLCGTCKSTMYCSTHCMFYVCIHMRIYNKECLEEGMLLEVSVHIFLSFVRNNK